MDNIFLLGLLGAFTIGVSKGGVKGISILFVAFLVLAYGARASTGIAVPLLIVGDVLAVWYYKKSTRWKYLIRFLPQTLVGIVIATFVGHHLNEAAFRTWIAVLVLISVAMMFFFEFKKVKVPAGNPWFSGPIGLATGFTTMIGNMAGPFSNLYFLATRLPKNEIIGTSAWVFFVVNIFKVPFHLFVWGTMTTASLAVDLMLLPAVFVGFLVGIKTVALFSESFFRWFLLGLTGFGALLILFG